MDDSTAQDKCNGVLVEIANDEALKALDERESGYSRVSVPLEQVQPWEGATMPDGDYTVFLYRANVCHLCLLACSCASITFITSITSIVTATRHHCTPTQQAGGVVAHSMHSLSLLSHHGCTPH